MKRLLAIFPLVLTACAGVLAEDAAERPLETYRAELLQLAFDGVSKMPLRPHIKNRSRAQQKVADACLALGMPEQARTYVEQMENWQRWLGYANLAHDYARQGDTDMAVRLVEKIQPALNQAKDRAAGRIVNTTPNELYDSLEDWRYQTVLTRLAEVQMLLQDAALKTADAETYGELNASRINAESSLQSDETFDESMARLRVYTEDQNFEIVHLGLVKMAALVGQHYDRVELMEFVENEVIPHIRKTPVFMRVDVLQHFAETALENGDAASAGQLIDLLDKVVVMLAPRPQFHIPEAVKLVHLRYDAGQTEQALAGLAALEAEYDAARKNIVNMDRAGLLCRIAEVYGAMGEMEKACALYSRAVEEGQVNPNARPQADDLNEICCSMALSGVEPTPALRAKLIEMNQNLSEPW